MRAAFVKNAQQNSLQNIQQNEQEIQLKAASESDFMQIITRNFWKLDISNKSDKNVVNLSLQSNFTVTVIQNSNIVNTVTCEFSTKLTVFVNLVSELIYFDLVVNEFSTNMNDYEMIFFMKNILIFYSRSIMLTIQSHSKKNSENSIRLSTMRHIKIQMNFNKNSLNFHSVMK